MSASSVAARRHFGWLDSILRFLGDRADIPRLISALDIFVWLSRGEGMPHVISEAGAAGVAVIATRDNGSEEQIADEETGLFVPHEDPHAVAIAIKRLAVDGRLRHGWGGRSNAKSSANIRQRRSCCNGRSCSRK